MKWGDKYTDNLEFVYCEIGANKDLDSPSDSYEKEAALRPGVSY